MTKTKETAVNDIAENLYREIDAIIQEHRLNRKDLPREEEYRGAQLIGTCVNSAYEANPAPSLTAVLRDVGKRLNASYVRGFSNVKLMQFAKTAHAFPLDITIRPELSWSQLKELFQIEDAKLRMHLMQVAADNDWPNWRIQIHGRGLEESLTHYHNCLCSPDPEALRYIRAYTAAYGIVDIKDVENLYRAAHNTLDAYFALAETIIYLKNNRRSSHDAGYREHEPLIWQHEGHIYVVAPELSPELAAPVYHQEDYRYSYDPYERANRYAELSRKLRANHIESRRSFILAQHKVIAAKSIDFEHVVQEMGVRDRLTYQLKQVIGQEYRDEDASSLYEGELEFALDKLLRYVALTGSPSPVDISYDVSFLFYCIGLGKPSALAHHVVTELLEQLYLQTPIWELHGHSLVDEKDWEDCPGSSAQRSEHNGSDAIHPSCGGV